MNKIITNSTRALTICIAVTLSLGAANASASASWDTSATGVARKEVVLFRDLDLSKIEGVTTLYGRISHAARDVCDPLETLQFPEAYRACVDKAIADAVAKVNRPLLSQYHQLRTKGDKAGIVQLAKAH